VSDADVKGEYAGLVKAAAAGNRIAMETLLERAQEVAYRFSLLVCGHPEDAEDVMQDALFKTYRHVGQISDPEAFRTWLYSTVRNACLMKRRRRVGEPSRFVSVERGDETDARRAPVDVADPARSVDQKLIDGWVDDRLRQALQHLPPAYRMIVVMREIEGLSTREVAAIAGVSEANVKQRLHRARLMLRKRLEQV
jgi:RNA polymerase sigma-70 factor, ECF subfamily